MLDAAGAEFDGPRYGVIVVRVDHEVGTETLADKRGSGQLRVSELVDVER